MNAKEKLIKKKFRSSIIREHLRSFAANQDSPLDPLARELDENVLERGFTDQEVAPYAAAGLADKRTARRALTVQ